MASSKAAVLRASPGGQRLASHRVNAQAANTVTATDGHRTSASGDAAKTGPTAVTVEEATFSRA